MTLDLWRYAHDAVEGCKHTGGVYGQGACAECVEKALARVVSFMRTGADEPVDDEPFSLGFMRYRERARERGSSMSKERR